MRIGPGTRRLAVEVGNLSMMKKTWCKMWIVVAGAVVAGQCCMSGVRNTVLEGTAGAGNWCIPAGESSVVIVERIGEAVAQLAAVVVDKAYVGLVFDVDVGPHDALGGVADGASSPARNLIPHQFHHPLPFLLLPSRRHQPFDQEPVPSSSFSNSF